jgi:pepF/M3 family oligoendopeptidase
MQTVLGIGHCFTPKRLRFTIFINEADIKEQAMTATERTLPHWDLTPFFPGLDSPEFEAALHDLVVHIDEVAALWDEHGVNKREVATPINVRAEVFDTVLQRLDELLNEQQLLYVYTYCFVTTDSRNNLAQAKLSELQRSMVRTTKLRTRWTAWIGSLDVDALLAQSAAARDHEWALRRAQESAQHQMEPNEEALAAELGPTGGSAWGRLHGNLSSQLMVTLELDGREQTLPMSEVRNLAFVADREVRRRAYEAELRVWEGNAVPLAAALNGVKGEVNTLSKRRGWESALDVALWDNTIDRETLNAMMIAARESFADFQRYLRAKAKMLGLEKLTWYDLQAPVGEGDGAWEWDAAESFITEHFGTYSPRLQQFAQRAFGEQWIDAEPRAGKRDGAYCVNLRRDESRVFSNFKPSFDGVRTLAHELGHAYHNLNLAERTRLQRQTPMALAETASIFCETIVRQAALREGGEAEQLAMIEASLKAACGLVVDISSRFLFEQNVFEQRQARELSVDELNELMLKAQRDTYGDALDQQVLHPYMWAVKPHYYSPGLSFYNYPYMFGLLFGLGLYARYEQDPEAFKAGYDDLLSSTGLADAATLAQRFGIDIRTPDFWRSSLDVIRADVDRFEQLVG